MCDTPKFIPSGINWCLREFRLLSTLTARTDEQGVTILMPRIVSGSKLVIVSGNALSSLEESSFRGSIMPKILLFLFICSCVHTEHTMEFNTSKHERRCPNSIFLKKDTHVVTRNDREVFESAKSRCSYHYPQSPCLKVFKVLGYQDYNATCGKAEEVSE